MTASSMVAINEYGKRMGETHHNASITDDIVEKIRDRHEYDGVTYMHLALEFNLSKNTIGKICRYERRAQRPARWKRMVIRNG